MSLHPLTSFEIQITWNKGKDILLNVDECKSRINHEIAFYLNGDNVW